MGWLIGHHKADPRLLGLSGARRSLGTDIVRLTFYFGDSVLKKIIVSIESTGESTSKIMKNKSWILVVQNHNRKKQLHVRRFGAIFGISPLLPKEAGAKKSLKKSRKKSRLLRLFLGLFCFSSFRTFPQKRADFQLFY